MNPNNSYYPPPPQPQPYGAPPPQQQQYGAPPPQQQQYSAPPEQYAPPQYYQNQQNPELGEAPPPNDKIKPTSGFKDVWAAGLYFCNLAAFIALSVVGLRTFSSNKGSYGGTAPPGGGITFDTDTVKVFGFAAIVGFGLSFLYLLLANIIPGPLITITFVLSILVYFAVTIYYFYMHYYSAAIVFLIFSCLYLFCFWSWRSRIPFAKVMLKSITSITRRYWSTIIFGILSLFIQTIFSIWFFLTVVGVYQTYSNADGSSNSKLNAAMVFLVFSFYWTSQVIAYVTHVTLAGVFATVYFLNNQVAHPIWGSAKRALTTSFGTICFGSLLVALINTIRYFIAVARADTDNPIFSFVLCILDCIIACFQGIFEWFNYYAFSGVAIYGEGFIPSAKRTWQLIQDRGIEAIINDNLIGNVLFMGSLLVGVLSSLLGYLYLLISKPAYNSGGGATPIVVLVCFIIGMSMFSTISTVISSGVATTFVCLAEDPEALRRSNYELYEALRQTWPSIVQGLH